MYIFFYKRGSKKRKSYISTCCLNTVYRNRNLARICEMQPELNCDHVLEICCTFLLDRNTIQAGSQERE